MFDGQAYLQSEGGAIGLQLTGVVARIIMDRWSGTMRRRMMINHLECFLMTKYVDDVYIFLQGLKKGMRYNKFNKKLEWGEDDESYDIEENNSTEYTTMNAWQEMASDIYTFINFTKDTPELHDDKFVPVLDVKVGRKEEGGLLYIHFLKNQWYQTW